MIAPEGKVNDTPALAAPLPAAIRSESQCLIQSFVSRTVTVVVRGLLAHGAGSLLACGTGGDVVRNVLSSDERGAFGIGTVSALADRRVELFLLVFEGRDKLSVDLCFNLVPGHSALAASRRVQRLVRHARFVQELKTWDAVVVAARRFPDFLGREVVIARGALDVRGSTSSRNCTGFDELSLLALVAANGVVLEQLFAKGLANGSDV